MKIVDNDADLAGLPLLPIDFSTNTFAQAVAVTPVPSKAGTYVYYADIKRDWRIGVVPHGGYLLSVLTHAVSIHFAIHHAALNQPHLANLSSTFLSRATPGPAQIVITELKLGRQFSTVRAQLLQRPSATKPPIICIEANITQNNLSLLQGATFTTNSLIDRDSIPRREDCEPWESSELMKRARPAAYKIDVLLPKGSDSTCSHPDRDPLVRNMWARWPDGSPLTIEAIPSLVDAFRPHLEDSKFEGKWWGVWVATLGLSVQIFDAGREGKGWEWLFMRVRFGEIVNGSVSEEVVVCDEDGKVVAVASHASLVLGGDRGIFGGKGAEAKL